MCAFPPDVCRILRALEIRAIQRARNQDAETSDVLQGSRRQWNRLVYTKVRRRVHQYVLYKQRKAERAAEGVRRELQGDPDYDEPSSEDDVTFWAKNVAGRSGPEVDAAEAARFDSGFVLPKSRPRDRNKTEAGREFMRRKRANRRLRKKGASVWTPGSARV